MSKFTAEQQAALAGLADYLLSLGAVAAPAEDAAPEAESDGLDDLDRAALKALISEEEIGVQVTKQMDDDAIRAAIREARAAAPAEDAPAEDAPADETPADDTAPEADPLDELRDVFKQLIAKKGDAAAEAVLKKFKADRISKVAAKDIPAAVKAVQAAIKAK